MKKNNLLYEIIVDGTRRYIGITNNLRRRSKEHLRLIKSDNNKYLYRKIRESQLEPSITILAMSDEMPILEAKRLECYLILKDYFNKKELWQSAPISFKYF